MTRGRGPADGGQRRKKLDEKKKTAGAKSGTPAGIKGTTSPEVKDGKPVFGTKAQPTAPRELNLYYTADERPAQRTPQEPSDAIEASIDVVNADSGTTLDRHV